jgi:hypothetical protein
MSLARLLNRVSEIDLEHWPSYRGELKIIAAILEAPVIEKILAAILEAPVIEKITHLALQARAPPLAPARGQSPRAA